MIFDAGYDLTRLAWLLRDLPVEVPGRLRSDRVMYFPVPPRLTGAASRRPGTGRRSGLPHRDDHPGGDGTQMVHGDRGPPAETVGLSRTSPVSGVGASAGKARIGNV